MTRRERNSVPDLIASPALRVAPLTVGGTTLALFDPGPITALAMMPGQGKAVAEALGPLGLAFPEPNRTAVSGAARIVWAGRDQAFLIGVPAPETGDVPAIDQTDGWAAFRLSGPLAADALMRFTPLNLRAMAEGAAARAPLNHMQMVLWREAGGFVFLVFRSMARTAWHEVEAALTALDARAQVAARG